MIRTRGTPRPHQYPRPDQKAHPPGRRRRASAGRPSRTSPSPSPAHPSQRACARESPRGDEGEIRRSPRAIRACASVASRARPGVLDHTSRTSRRATEEPWQCHRGGSRARSGAPNTLAALAASQRPLRAIASAPRRDDTQQACSPDTLPHRLAHRLELATADGADDREWNRSGRSGRSRTSTGPQSPHAQSPNVPTFRLLIILRRAAYRVRLGCM